MTGVLGASRAEVRHMGKVHTHSTSFTFCMSCLISAWPWSSWVRRQAYWESSESSVDIFFWDVNPWLISALMLLTISVTWTNRTIIHKECMSGDIGTCTPRSSFSLCKTSNNCFLFWMGVWGQPSHDTDWMLKPFCLLLLWCIPGMEGLWGVSHTPSLLFSCACGAILFWKLWQIFHVVLLTQWYLGNSEHLKKKMQ